MLSDEALSRLLAGWLEAAGIGTQTPTPGFPVIAAKRLPASPDEGIAITVYLAEDDLMVATRRVQFWFRGKPRDPFGPDRLAQDVYQVMRGRHHDGQVSRIWRDSIAVLGIDGNGRDERSDNYTIILSPERTAP